MKKWEHLLNNYVRRYYYRYRAWNDNFNRTSYWRIWKIRTGRANPNLVTSIQVDYYGTKTPLQQLASVSVPDPRLLVIQPFDKSSFEEIEKAIQNADIGLNPATDGEIIRIPIPPLSEERRKELSKVASKASEDTKVSIRSHRRSGIDKINELKDDLPADEIKRYESKIQ